MKPHLFLLLLLFIASILCNPLLSVDRPATAEAATIPWKSFLEGFGRLSKAKYSQWINEIENVSKAKNLQRQSQVCKQLVYNYVTQKKKNAGEPMAMTLKGLEMYMKYMKLPLPFVKFCIKAVEEYEKKHP